jgi:NDP-sugar pyrophosphorylase family protein
MKSTAVVLANIPLGKLGLTEDASLLDNKYIKIALNFCGSATKVVFAMNKDDAQVGYESQLPANYSIKFLPETEGALATIGLTLDLLPEDGNIVIVPTNASISENLNDFVNFMTENEADVGMAVIQSNSQELSYVREVEGFVVEIHEKEVVGNLACAGIYFFSSKKLLLECIHWTLINDVRKNGLLYIAPSMNYCITRGMRVIPFQVDPKGYNRYKYEIG